MSETEKNQDSGSDLIVNYDLFKDRDIEIITSAFKRQKDIDGLEEWVNEGFHVSLYEFLDNLIDKFPDNDDLKKAKESIKKASSILEKQGELWPVLTLQKSVEIKKEFALNFGGLGKIEKDHKHLLSEKLSSGLTLQQHIDKVKTWFNELHGEDLGNWIKLFAFTKAVKDFSETALEAANFQEIAPGRYCFKVKRNKDLFQFFIRPDKKSGQFTERAKDKILKWLHDNQSTIEFPMIIGGKVWNFPMRIYEYAENVSDKEILFKVDTNILESEFRDYVSITTDDVDAIEEAWETIADKDERFKKYSLNGFLDVPLKFLLTLKNIYSGELQENKEGNFFWCPGNLTPDSLDERLGNLLDRVKTHLKKRKYTRTGETGKLPAEIKSLIIDTAFTIARDKTWVFSMPKYKDGRYNFMMNPGKFSRKKTAEKLKAIGNA